jgi:hypothetical protein
MMVEWRHLTTACWFRGHLHLPVVPVLARGINRANPRCCSCPLQKHWRRSTETNQMTNRILFIHGKDGSSQGFKVQHLRRLYPELLAPDFPRRLLAAHGRLEQVIEDASGWTHRRLQHGRADGRGVCLPASRPGGQAGAAGPGAGLHRSDPDPPALQRRSHGDLSRPAGRRGAPGGDAAGGRAALPQPGLPRGRRHPRPEPADGNPRLAGPAGSTSPWPTSVRWRVPSTASPP